MSEAAIQKGLFKACKTFSNPEQKTLTLIFFSPLVSKPSAYLFLASYFKRLYFNFGTLDGSKLQWAGDGDVFMLKTDG